ncbi:metal-dependent transcriptional regulator [Candidatus Saganbacteria bacterium]|nr:metal-dependent transcriptional regulator [Candidatus Saganbacteria bacterium]
MSNQEIDEILEIIWMKKEKGKNDLCAIEDDIKRECRKNLIAEMQTKDLLQIISGKVELTSSGEKEAASLIRRHRLAERLLLDVLETKNDQLEASACEFEHILSEEVTAAICTLLGHPKECPHGLAIPPGQCCEKSNAILESVVSTLDKVAIGETAVVAYILTRDHPRLHKLMSFGITPGVEIKMHQKFPSYVIQVEETQIALEKEVVRSIYVRRNK